MLVSHFYKVIVLRLAVCQVTITVELPSDHKSAMYLSHYGVLSNSTYQKFIKVACL